MKIRPRNLVTLAAGLALAWCAILAAGCASNSNASRGAAKGAERGAVSGAVGGIVGAMVWGGNVAEVAVKSAAVGAATGATAGGMAGADRDRAEREREQEKVAARQEQLRRKMGEDAWNGVVALEQCKHEVALANAREAMKSDKDQYALAGLWLEVLIEADRRREDDARALFPEVIARDRDIRNEAEAETQMRAALQKLTEVRTRDGLPAVCPT